MQSQLTTLVLHTSRRFISYELTRDVGIIFGGCEVEGCLLGVRDNTSGWGGG